MVHDIRGPLAGIIGLAQIISEQGKENNMDEVLELEQDQINSILSGDSTTTQGTDGEKGYGFGLALVKHLIDGLKGTLRITSNQNGATFEVELPQ